MAKYVRPTLETKFHIDFGWWQRPGQNLSGYLQRHLCPQAKTLHPDYSPHQTFDWVNPDTGEVYPIDLAWHVIHTHCSQSPDFIDEHMSLTTVIFRLFIANNNTPLTVLEIHDKLKKKSPELILKTISGHQIYEGIRPINQSV
jgi:hypothetical protein